MTDDDPPRDSGRSPETSTDDESSVEPPSLSVEDLANERPHGERKRIHNIPQIDGEELFSPSNIVPIMGLSAVVLDDDTGLSGSDLLDVLEDIGGWQPSPGSTYPALHDMEEEGLLARRDMVRSKRYYVKDPAAVDARLESYMIRLDGMLQACHLARERLAEEYDLDRGDDTDR